jgi:hypothetical protein
MAATVFRAQVQLSVAQSRHEGRTLCAGRGGAYDDGEQLCQLLYPWLLHRRRLRVHLGLVRHDQAEQLKPRRPLALRSERGCAVPNAD